MKEPGKQEDDFFAPPADDGSFEGLPEDGEELRGLADDAMLQEATAQTPGQGLATGPREFFWGTVAPLVLIGAIGVAAVTLLLSLLLLEDTGRAPVYAGLAAAGATVVFLPLEYYVVRSRVEQPLHRLECELRGYLPWRPEGDVMFGSLRRAIDYVRAAAHSAREELEEETGRLEETYARLQELQQADHFAERAARDFHGREGIGEIAPAMGDLVRTVWPADDVILLEVRDQEVRIVYRESRGRQIAAGDSDGTPTYRRNALPAPVKEALRRGFYAEAGLPFSQDSAFPEARSFVAMSLEHRGSAAGVLLATSSELTPPAAEPLKRVRPLFSLAYSRSVYIAEAEEAAVRDSLTGAYTHNHFLSAVRNEVARSNRYSRPVSCVLLDIDRLRRINDGYGAGHGDEVIIEVADLLQRAIRTTDTLARVSGGTFAVLLPETAYEPGVAVAERLRESVEDHPFIIHRGQIERMTVTVGVASHPPRGVTALSLVDAARRSLREAKRAGRNRVAATPPGEGVLSGDAEGNGRSV